MQKGNAGFDSAVSGSNPMHEKPPAQQSARSHKTMCCGLGLGGAISLSVLAGLIFGGAIVGITMNSLMDEDDDGEASQNSLSSTSASTEFAASTAESLASNACPSEGQAAALTNPTEYFATTYIDIAGPALSCDEAGAIGDATASTLGVLPNATFVRVLSIGTRRVSTAISSTNKGPGHLRQLQSVSRVEQTILARDIAQLQSIEASMAQAYSDGSLEAGIQAAAPAESTGVLLPPIESLVRVGRLANPSTSPTASASPSPSTSSTPAPSLSASPSTTATPSTTVSASPSTTASADPTTTATATASTTASASPSTTTSADPTTTATATASTTASASPSTTTSVSPTPSATSTPTASASPSPVATVVDLKLIDIVEEVAISTLDAEVVLRNERTGQVSAAGWILSGSDTLRVTMPGTDLHAIEARGEGFVQVLPAYFDRAQTGLFSDAVSWFPIYVAKLSDQDEETTRVFATNSRRPTDFELTTLIGNTSDSLVHASAGTKRGNGDSPEWCKAHHERTACSFGSTSMASPRDAYDFKGWQSETVTVTDGNSSCSLGQVDGSMEAMTCHVRIMLVEYSPGGVYNVDDPTDDSEEYYIHDPSEVDETFVPRVVLGANGYNATMRPSLFHYVASPTVAVVGANSSTDVVRISAREAVTQETVEHAARTGAWCSEWFVGTYDLATKQMSEYRDNGVSWVLDEFFMTNWWEGYVWNAEDGTVSARNASFVPSNVSTYPFLCSLPPHELGDTFANNLYDDDKLYETWKGSYLAQYIAMFLEPDLFRTAEDDTSRVDDPDYQVHTYNLRRVDRSGKVGYRRLLEADGRAEVDANLRLRVERLLANQDPESGEPLAEAGHVPDYIPEEVAEDLERKSMFQGRDHSRPWLLSNGRPLLY